MQEDRETYTIPEIAKMLGIGRNQAYDAARRRDFPVIQIGKRLLVPKRPFHRMLDADAVMDPGKAA